MRTANGVRQARLGLLLDVLGGALALWAGSRTWQTVTAARARPLADEVVGVSGRTVDGGVLALALVALAGAVALLATRGLARRAVGAVLTLTGLLLAWRSALGLQPVSPARAAQFLIDAHGGVGVSAVSVVADRAWPALSLLCGVLVAAAGALAAVTGARWTAMSARYESPAAPTDASLWSALDRGDDPTVDSRSAGEATAE